MAQDYPSHVRRWDVFEIVLSGTADGNPYTEQTLTGIFTSRNESKTVTGFYDGDGIYRIRFMPSYEGRYTFILRASFFDGTLSGAFYSDPSDKNVHGPVQVINQYHFAYKDGTPFYPFGTTSSLWELQDDDIEKKTLETLKQSSFNKLRFCIFPKYDRFNLNDPDLFPYEGIPENIPDLTEDNFTNYMGKSEENHFDHTRFNPAYFRKIEKSIKQLRNADIEADLTLFHPYDRWGFASMSEEENVLYINYIINRFSAYRNVWWSLADGWDLFKNKSENDWERYASLLVKKDPYHHLRSIHGNRKTYDQTKSWITHVSGQITNLYKTAEATNELREEYQKPVVMDELGFEGNSPYGSGSLTGEEEVRRFWETALRGGYPGHGETLVNTDDKLIWSLKGGTLNGESWKRVSFLMKIINEVPGNGIVYDDNEIDSICGMPEEDEPVKSQYLYYYSFMRPSWRDFHIDDNTDFVAEIIDTWNMTIKVAGIFHGSFRLDLPGKQYIAVRLRKAKEEDYKAMNTESDDSEENLQPHDSEADAATDDRAEIIEPEIVEEAPEDDNDDENDYLEATVVSEKSETAPAQNNVENDFSPFPADEDVQQEEFMKEETVEEKDEPVDEDFYEDEDTDDVDLTAIPSEDDEDELPDIVTGKFTRIDADREALENTDDLRKMPIEDDQKEERTGNSGTLNILTSFRHRRRNN